jgi:hypothetical protein
MPREPRVSHRAVSVALVVACFAFTGAGLGVTNLCDGGYSLILFGVGMAFLAILIYRMGAWATIIPFAIITASLIAGGLYGLSLSGCHL